MNKIVHFEIPFKDKGRAIEFYTKAFGWQCMDMPEMNYVIVRTGPTDEQNMPKEPGFINGGMMNGEGDMPTPYPILVLDVENIEEHMKKAKEAGAEEIMAPIKVGDMGMYARIKDPEGNIIGIWQTLKQG